MGGKIERRKISKKGGEAKTIRRRCLVCGKALAIKLGEGDSYTGGHYFGIATFPVGKIKTKPVAKAKKSKDDFPAFEWDCETEKVEYWECDACYRG